MTTIVNRLIERVKKNAFRDIYGKFRWELLAVFLFSNVLLWTFLVYMMAT